MLAGRDRLAVSLLGIQGIMDQFVVGREGASTGWMVAVIYPSVVPCQAGLHKRGCVAEGSWVLSKNLRSLMPANLLGLVVIW